MNKKLLFSMIVLALASFLNACDRSASQAVIKLQSGTQAPGEVFVEVSVTPTITPTVTETGAPTATVTPTATATWPPTFTPLPVETDIVVPDPTETLKPLATLFFGGQNWNFTVPGEPGSLPTELAYSIEYVQPPQNCSAKNDPNFTCSTRKGQSTVGDFVLPAGEGLRMTGDLIKIYKDGKLLLKPFDSKVKQSAWIVINASGEDLNLKMEAKYGSFRGFFGPTDWDSSQLENMVGLAMYQYIASDNPLPTAEPFGPTPVLNCESGSACEKANVYVLVWDGETWVVAIQGFYAEGITPFWSQK